MRQLHLDIVFDFFRALQVDAKIINIAKHQFKFFSLDALQVLLRQGEQQKYGFLILSGILRSCHYTDKGEARSKEYYFEGELSFLYSSWLTNSLANYQIEVLKNAEVIRIPLSLLNVKGWQSAKIELLQQQLLYKEAKEAFLLLNNPEERYLHLIQHFPNWVTSLNDAQLSSYIGISPISFSRIKRRLAKN